MPFLSELGARLKETVSLFPPRCNNICRGPVCTAAVGEGAKAALKIDIASNDGSIL
jgi:hypothetical protein